MATALKKTPSTSLPSRRLTDDPFGSLRRRGSPHPEARGSDRLHRSYYLQSCSRGWSQTRRSRRSDRPIPSQVWGRSNQLGSRTGLGSPWASAERFRPLDQARRHWFVGASAACRRICDLPVSRSCARLSVSMPDQGADP
jgi:hypothetical protein